MKIRHKFIVLVLSTLLLSGCNSDYKLSAVSCITKAEAVEMLVNTLMQETGIPTFNFKQGTVEGYEAETEVETVTEDSGIGTSVELEEDEYQGDNPYDQGTSPSDQQSIEDMAQQLIADYLKDYAQDNQVEVDVPGGTPYDPSQDGQIVIGDNPALAGDYIN